MGRTSKSATVEGASGAAKAARKKPDFSGVAGKLMAAEAVAGLEGRGLVFGTGHRTSPYDGLIEELRTQSEAALARGDARAAGAGVRGWAGAGIGVYEGPEEGAAGHLRRTRRQAVCPARQARGQSLGAAAEGHPVDSEDVRAAADATPGGAAADRGRHVDRRGDGEPDLLADGEVGRAGAAGGRRVGAGAFRFAEVAISHQLSGWF